MANKALWERFKSYIYEHYGREAGTMLVHAGIITWVMATLSQVVAVAVNKNIPSDQKKFLVPQEIADGALNVLAFYLVTSSMKNIASKLVSTGKWSTAEIRNFVEKQNSEKKLNIKLNSMDTNLSQTFRDDESFHAIYDKFKGGMDMIAATIGSVAACNVVTPIIRNKIGAVQQKRSIAKEKSIKTSQYVNPYKNSSLKV